MSLLHRLFDSFRSNPLEGDIAEEQRHHIELAARELQDQGLSAAEAQRQAERRFGNAGLAREDTRRQDLIPWVDDVFRDVRIAIRGLRRSPSYSIVVLVTLAFGIGANTALFSIMNKLLLEMLPVTRPRELVILNPTGMRSGWTPGGMTWSYPAYRGISETQQVFTGLLAERIDDATLTIDGASRRVTVSIVSGNYFEVLGVNPIMGRLFSADDDRVRSGHPVVVLSHAFWLSQLGGRTDILGRTVRLKGHPFTVVGIGEKGFNGLEVGGSVDVFVPAAMLAEVVTYGGALDGRTSYIFQLYGRLKNGVTRDQAQAQLQPLYVAQLEQDVAMLGQRAPRGNGWREGRVLLEDGHRGTSRLRGRLETPLTVVMAMTVVVLLIACANIAGLQIARVTSRSREICIRLAIGASRPRVVRQLLIESLVLAGLGALAGLPIAWWTVQFLLAEMGEQGERLKLVMSFLDARALLFVLAVSISTAVVFGLLPALNASRTSVSPGLKAGGSADGGGQVRLRSLLVTAQVALGLVLVTASGLFIRTLQNLRNTDTGFRTDRLIQFQINTGTGGYDRVRSEAIFRLILEDLRGLPGVSSATLGVSPVLSNSLIGFWLDVEGYTHGEREDRASYANAVAPGYLQMVGIPLIHGRDFTEADTAESRRVAIVSESFVKKYFPKSDPLGRTIGLRYAAPERFFHEIIGVSKDARTNNLRDEPVRTFYLPYTQFDVLSNTYFVVRTASDPTLLGGAIRALVKRHDPNLPVVAYRTLDEQIDRLLQPERLVASLSTAFALLATGLAAIGLYGVMAFSVARRTREIGIRMALGAQRAAVLRMVLRDVGTMACIGVGVGASLAFALARYVKSQLYGVSAHDLLTIGGAALLVTAVALVSGWLPARRASRVEPMLALRHE